MKQPSVEHHYVERLNRVVDWLTAHLDERVSLGRLARLADFSPFHFHRIFKAMTGETVKAYVARVRLERALFLMRTAPGLSLLEVSVACGLGSASSFSRAFKAEFGVPPSQADIPRLLEERRGRANGLVECSERSSPEASSSVTDVDIRIESKPPLRIAYVRVVGSYVKPDAMLAAFHRLEAWAAAENVCKTHSELIGLSIDDPDIVPHAKCRYDIGRTVERRPAAGHGISYNVLPAHEWAVCRIQGGLDRFAAVYDYLFKQWLPASGYQPASLPALEIFRQHPDDIGWETFDIDACLPILPLHMSTHRKI